MTVSQLPTQLRPSQQPRLPAAPVEYDRTYVDALTGILRQYFNEVDNLTQSLLTNTGGRFLRTVCGSFQDTTTQTATANTATAMTFNTTDTAATNNVSVVSSSKITVVYPGIYNLQFSSQFQNTDTQIHDVSVWIRQGNGGGASTDVAGSNGLISVPNSHGGTPGHIITGWNYLISMAANDHIQLYWSTDNTAVTMQNYAAGVTPTRPTTASVIATMTFVSAPLT